MKVTAVKATKKVAMKKAPAKKAVVKKAVVKKAVAKKVVAKKATPVVAPMAPNAWGLVGVIFDKIGVAGFVVLCLAISAVTA